MIIALACYSNELKDMPETTGSVCSYYRDSDGAIFCCSGISTLKYKIISLLLALLAYSTQNQQTQMCDYNYYL